MNCYSRSTSEQLAARLKPALLSILYRMSAQETVGKPLAASLLNPLSVKYVLQFSSG